MEQIQTKNASATAVAGMTLLEGFMSESYDFRHNVLADKYEVREKGTAAWRPLTDKGINSIARRLKRDLSDRVTPTWGRPRRRFGVVFPRSGVSRR